MRADFPHIDPQHVRVGHLALVSAKDETAWLRIEQIDADGDIQGVTKYGGNVCFLHSHIRDARMGLEVEDYRRALRAQSASNGLALTLSLAEVMPCIVSEMLFEEKSYDDALRHPIYRLMLHQISYLSCNASPVSLADYSDAVNTCEAFIKSSDLKSALETKTT